MKFLSVALLVLRKDFAIEMRSYEIFSTTLFFAVACVAIFSFAFVKEGQAEVDAAAAREVDGSIPYKVAGLHDDVPQFFGEGGAERLLAPGIEMQQVAFDRKCLAVGVDEVRVGDRCRD